MAYLAYDWLTGCCGIGVIFDFPEPPFFYEDEESTKVTKHDLDRAIRDIGSKLVLASLNENQARLYEKVLLRCGFKIVDKVMGNELQKITLYKKVVRKRR